MPFPLSERDIETWDDILSNGRAAQNFVRGLTFAAFADDQRTNYAVVRCLEIVSEASRRLSADTKARHPDVQWREIADAGNFYRHSYHRVTLDIVWGTVHEKLPILVAAAEAELEASPDR